ncbi:uncharacterized protein EV154DRAFT_554438 [Mucor mucedo]|uniref:uncharacterized protein n=1 Tax=Mucor mucedo TaxID=29922 RepID=UPI00221FD088|nr:uncharacterized protein EV154DRAFT_554438 [Mucor mucedo]KAI7887733.1 hypothetical protein EV154DRAFT_554438 [Mucor mucedo]
MTTYQEALSGLEQTKTERQHNSDRSQLFVTGAKRDLIASNNNAKKMSMENYASARIGLNNIKAQNYADNNERATKMFYAYIEKCHIFSNNLDIITWELVRQSPTTPSKLYRNFESIKKKNIGHSGMADNAIQSTSNKRKRKSSVNTLGIEHKSMVLFVSLLPLNTTTSFYPVLI